MPGEENTLPARIFRTIGMDLSPLNRPAERALELQIPVPIFRLKSGQEPVEMVVLSSHQFSSQNGIVDATKVANTAVVQNGRRYSDPGGR